MSFSLPSLHIILLWPEALSHKTEIFRDICSAFEVVQTFDVEWDEDKFLQNLIVFYSHSQKHLSRKDLEKLLLGKMMHCGVGRFFLIVFRDHCPKMELRKTSSGRRLVNVNVFDRKAKYRELSGGGHRVHGSDDDWETNKDLTILFGLNSEDFCKSYPNPQDTITIHHNCIGVDGYSSIQQLFYVLNNTIKYCVLRNYECLPHEYTVEGHGDIDLLVEDKNYMAYLTLAKPLFTEPYRVYHTIRISDQDIPFDFRYIGDNYYDAPWEEHILDFRHLEKDLFYIPSLEDLFYSLLYHAYVQKHVVRHDYLPKLKSLGNKMGIGFLPNLENVFNLLDGFMEKNEYEYIRPDDVSVVYNMDNLKRSDYAFRYGNLVKRVNERGTNGYTYDSLVYRKDKSYIKRGTSWLIGNEFHFLSMLEDQPFSPKIIRFEEGDMSLLEINEVDGKESTDFFKIKRHQSKSYIMSFIKECIAILEVLNEKGICHRDFLPSNLIVEEKDDAAVTVSLIDYGWAVSNDELLVKEPKHLGGYYKPNGYYSDVFSFGTLLLENWYDLPFINKISSLLRTDAADFESQKRLLDQVQGLLSSRSFSIYDVYRLFIRRHQRVQTLRNHIKRIFFS